MIQQLIGLCSTTDFVGKTNACICLYKNSKINWELILLDGSVVDDPGKQSWTRIIWTDSKSKGLEDFSIAECSVKPLSLKWIVSAFQRAAESPTSTSRNLPMNLSDGAMVCILNDSKILIKKSEYKKKIVCDHNITEILQLSFWKTLLFLARLGLASHFGSPYKGNLFS